MSNPFDVLAFCGNSSYPNSSYDEKIPQDQRNLNALAHGSARARRSYPRDMGRLPTYQASRHISIDIPGVREDYSNGYIQFDSTRYPDITSRFAVYNIHGTRIAIPAEADISRIADMVSNYGFTRIGYERFGSTMVPRQLSATEKMALSNMP